MISSELLDDHQDTLKEEGSIIELRQKVKELSAEGKTAAEKINRLQADLDYEVAVKSSRENEMEQLRGESRGRGPYRLSCWALEVSWRRRAQSCRREILSCN